MTVTLKAPPEKTRVVHINMNTRERTLIGDFTSLDTAFRVVDDFNNGADPRNGYHAYNDRGQWLRSPAVLIPQTPSQFRSNAGAYA